MYSQYSNERAIIMTLEHMPGDILFYEALQNSIYDKAITIVTSSKYVHVAIAISAIQKIEALSNGIVLTPIDTNRPPSLFWSYTLNVPLYDRESLHNALNWLISQKGNLYGWGDNVNALIEKSGFNLAINEGDHFDCSALATEFLIKAGKVPGLQNITDPHKVTPGLLVEYLEGSKP